MIKCGIYLDVENLIRCGGRGMNYASIIKFVEAQGAKAFLANAYMAQDVEREAQDYSYRIKRKENRAWIRRQGFRLVLKRVQRFSDEDGEIITKANADLDLAVDALQQSTNLDYILLGTGDGDFLPLARTLQSHGKRVDLLGFQNVSRVLQDEVDRFHSGFLVPGILPLENGRFRGVLHSIYEDKGYGFLACYCSPTASFMRDDVFLHINHCRVENGEAVTMATMVEWKNQQTILEFAIEEDQKNRLNARNVSKANVHAGKVETKKASS